MKVKIEIEINEKEIVYTEDEMRYIKVMILGMVEKYTELMRNIYIGKDDKNWKTLFRKFLDNSKTKVHMDSIELGEEFRKLELDKEIGKNVTIFSP